MFRKISLLLPLLACVACVPPNPPPAPTAAPPAPQAATTPTLSPAIAPPVPGVGPKWDVTRVTCAQLLAADDDDRAAAAMFYYGYLAASARIKVIDVARMDENVSRVVEQCIDTPNMTIPQAYRAAFRRAARS